jgi:hypothetical protein
VPTEQTAILDNNIQKKTNTRTYTDGVAVLSMEAEPIALYQRQFYAQSHSNVQIKRIIAVLKALRIVLG